MEVQNIQAVAKGAKYCDCGGMMIADPKGGHLMSNPPQQKIYCPFCGETDTVLAPYEVEIQFKRAL